MRRGSSDEAERFSFFRIWTVPRTILQLTLGNVALMNLWFLAADDELECGDLLIRRPVLEHLRIESHTLDNNRLALYGADCSAVENHTADSIGGYIT